MLRNVLVKLAHETAKEKGWWEKPRSARECVMLQISEIAEATECVRNGEPTIHYGRTGLGKAGTLENYYLEPTEKNRKPEGEAIELIDCVIRLADFFGYAEVDLDHSVETELELAEDSPWSQSFKYLTPLEQHLDIVTSLSKANNSEWKNIKNSISHLAAAFVKIEKLFEFRNWNFVEALQLKLDYNNTRAYRHGGKLL